VIDNSLAQQYSSGRRKRAFIFPILKAGSHDDADTDSEVVNFTSPHAERIYFLMGTAYHLSSRLLRPPRSKIRKMSACLPLVYFIRSGSTDLSALVRLWDKPEVALGAAPASKSLAIFHL
jgi:hypothetical protein